MRDGIVLGSESLFRMPDSDAGAVLHVDLADGTGFYVDPAMPEPAPGDTIRYGIHEGLHQEVQYRGVRWRQRGYSFVTGAEFH